MKGSRHLVLVGDHKQLPPVVQSQAAKEGGLGKSLFERLMDAGAPSALLQVGWWCATCVGVAQISDQHNSARDEPGAHGSVPEEA
jgi:hypothetical protein